ncbi:hypothetical protein [Breoghania sp.]|uniref:hypothetical protein n=1 Tax=Breoghania sp. TaxID=2065378 RepID=UPI0026347FAA|nr:hypothetical protein [Breoghania sp.]MDJ0930645.1 hypothetical protein [Breoghania sp.]
MKLYSDGTALFNRSFGGRAADRINDLSAGADGNFVMVGETRSFGTQTNDGILVRLTAGNKTPPKPLVRDGDDTLNGVAVCNDGTILAVGYTNSETAKGISAWLLQPSADMRTVENEKILNAPREASAQDIALLDDGIFVVAGTTRADKNAEMLIWLRRMPLR